MRLAPCIAAAAAAALLAGCGTARTAVPRLTTAQIPSRTVHHAFPKAGVRLALPAGWRITPGGADTLVASVASGPAAVAIWRYRRSEPLPSSKAALRRARRALVRQVESGGKATVSSARLVHVHGTPGIQLVGRETVGSLHRAMRSTHLFAHGAEVVIDELAPRPGFARLDRAVFRPLVRSVRLVAPSGA